MPMIKPFKRDYLLTQGFGENPQSYAKFGMKGHNGLDYGTPTGTEVIAPHGGKIIEATNDPTGYGYYVKIENTKEGSVLAHLKEFKVNVGQDVTEGQVVGLSDNTGNSTGPHLHWGYYTLPRNRQNGYAGFIDQLGLISNPTTSETPSTEDVKKYQQGSGKFDQIVKRAHELKLIDYDNPERYYNNDDIVNLFQKLYEKSTPNDSLVAENSRLKNILENIKKLFNS